MKWYNSQRKKVKHPVATKCSIFCLPKPFPWEREQGGQLWFVFGWWNVDVRLLSKFSPAKWALSVHTRHLMVSTPWKRGAIVSGDPGEYSRREVSWWEDSDVITPWYQNPIIIALVIPAKPCPSSWPQYMAKEAILRIERRLVPPDARIRIFQEWKEPPFATCLGQLVL